MHRINIFNQNVSREDPLKPTEEFLNFPPTLQQINMISTEKELINLQNLIASKIAKDGEVKIGVDAEWSAYVAPSKATILQMAMTDSVHILDLESQHISPQAYHAFLSYLFDTPQIMKIGFQFGEDLHQLRAAFRNCTSLYKPNNVVCVGKLLMDLLKEIGKSDKAEEIKREFLPFLVEDAGEKESADSSMEEVSGADKSTSAESVEGSETEKAQKEQDANAKQFANKGLSYICEKILGRPLDKTEQCSVWDRRPLRNLQVCECSRHT